MKTSPLPIAVIGAGPVGLAAAAHLQERGLDFVVLESGPTIGASMREWSHVQLFSPWEYNVDPAAERLLRSAGWEAPPPNVYPKGHEVLSRYLEPLSQIPAINKRLLLDARVTGITRQGRDKMKTDVDRVDAAFRIRFESLHGEEEWLARAVIDTAGTWRTPNPLGSEGIPARGERALAPMIRYGIPDVLGRERTRYAGRRVLVAGSGHSAFNALVDLVKLADEKPETSITWIVRRDNVGKIFGGGERDQLAARGELGLAVRRLLDAGQLKLVLSFRTEAIERGPKGFILRSGESKVGPVDEIIVATGFRPDFSYLRELQISLDPVVESTRVLAPMIDPNLHSCGTVRPHGHAELSHPEQGFYIAGMKSYGRAPTFLLRTGYEQVRSIVAALAEDFEAATRVELVLPETGVCSSQHNDGDNENRGCGGAEPVVHPVNRGAAECCGGAPAADPIACCKKDEAAKTAGEAGCGCDQRADCQ